MVKELRDGAAVDEVLLVKRLERLERRDGKPYLRLLLGDRSGAVRAMVWEQLESAAELLQEGQPVHVKGRYSVHPNFGPEIKIAAFEAAAAGSFDTAALREQPVRAVSEMEGKLRTLQASVRDPWLSRLLAEIFDPESASWSAYRVAPAAKYYHQAYVHGLLEHSLSVAEAVDAVAGFFPGIDRELALTGALLHDLGKLESYASDGGAVAMTDDGRLFGEIAIGYYRIRRLIDGIEGFPEQLARALLHIILAHHGALENGSPVVPCTREATLVHMIDNLGGRLGSFDRLERELAPGSRWSEFDRALGAAAYFEPASEKGPAERAGAGAAALVSGG